MNKITFLIPLFLIIGCSTPEIHIPSYHFGTDTSSTKNNEKQYLPATSALPGIDNEKKTIPTRQEDIKTIDTIPSIIGKKLRSFFSLFKPGAKVKKEYYTGGKIRSKLVLDHNTEDSGLLYRYGYDGKVISTVPIKHGIKNGRETLFDTKGMIMKSTPYINGDKNGVVEIYYPDGKVMAQIAYVNNKRHGRASKYNHDGSLNKEIRYTRGMPD